MIKGHGFTCIKPISLPDLPACVPDFTPPAYVPVEKKKEENEPLPDAKRQKQLPPTEDPGVREETAYAPTAKFLNKLIVALAIHLRDKHQGFAFCLNLL